MTKPAVRYLFLPDDYVTALTVTQLGIAVNLMRRAAWARREVQLRNGGAVVLERGEVLFGEQSLADDLGVSRSTVRKTIRRLEASLGAKTRAARGLPEGRDQGLPRGRGRGLPASVLMFGKHRDFIFPEKDGAYPGADLGAEGGADTGAPYYPSTQQPTPPPPPTEKLPAPSAPALELTPPKARRSKPNNDSVEPLRLRVIEFIRSTGTQYVDTSAAAERTNLRRALKAGASEEQIEAAFRAVYDRKTWRPRVQDVSRVLTAASERGSAGTARPGAPVPAMAGGFEETGGF